VLLDLAALALRLDRLLTARLMPIPNKKAGEPTGFAFAFFANSKMMSLDSEVLKGPLSHDESFSLRPRSGLLNCAWPERQTASSAPAQSERD
jgi:hypothetical protein